MEEETEDNAQQVKTESLADEPDAGVETPQEENTERLEAEKKAKLGKQVAEKLKVLKNKQKAALSSITKSQNELKKHIEMPDYENLHKVKSLFDVCNEKFSVYHDCFIAHCALLPDDAIEDEEKKYMHRESVNTQLQEEVRSWIARAETHLTEQLSTSSVKSKHSRPKSTRSSSSRSTSRSSKSSQAYEKARLAELLVEKKMLQKKHKQEAEQEAEREKQEVILAEQKRKNEVILAEQKRKKEAIRAKQKREREETELEIEVAKAEARNNAFNDIYKGIEAETPKRLEIGQKPTEAIPPTETQNSNEVATSIGLNPDAATYKPVTHQQPQDPQPSTLAGNPPTLEAQTQQRPIPPQQPSPTQTYSHTDLLMQTQQQMFLPRPEVPKFTGDPIDYKAFIMAFDARILPHVSSEMNALYYLDQQLQGEPKNLIGGCLFMTPDTGYYEARKLLDKEYGDPFKVATSYINKLAVWPNIRADDSNKLKQLLFFLTKCNNVMQSISHMTVLNHAPNMQMIVKKLPGYLQNKWRDTVARLKQRGEVSFSDLVNFINHAVASATDPVFGKEAFGQNNTRYQKQNTSFATNVSPDSETCLLCSQNHDLDECTQFKQKSLSDRRSFLKEKRVCFGCYGYKHVSKNCVKKRECEICHKKHPTGLHDPDFQPRYKTNSNPVVTNGSTHISMIQPNFPTATNQVEQPTDLNNDVRNAVNDAGQECSTPVQSTCHAFSSSINRPVLQAILPVKVRCDKSGVTMNTYALYDNGSSGCFVTNTLKENLRAAGSKTTLALQTMHGSEYIQTESITNLFVSDMEGNNTLPLPKAFTRQEIPVSHNQIPKREELRSCPALSPVVDVLPPYYPGMDIGLLIGSNCPRALEPLQVIPPEGDGPFAVRYRHGWTLNGPIEVQFDTVNKIVNCNKIMFRDVTRVHESNCDHHKEILTMFESDFNTDCAEYPDETGLSQEDRKFLNIVQQQHEFESGHHILPLPFREETPNLSNNRSQAESRLQWQKKKMQKDENYKRDYTEFMRKLVTKGYAHKVPKEETSTNQEAYYLLHHGVYHPQKKKIRVVFDGSAKYCGSSLNDNLLQGPDLANSLVGVLTRFRQEYVATISDIEAMFYQVKVPQRHQDYLRFLWWTDGDLGKEPDEYRMSVHIFGAASSPSIANYALQTTANNYKDTDTEAATVIRRNFYVDDCLLSVEDDDKAIRLVKSLVEGCAQGGFRLTKFISNSKQVLASIPESEASITVQDLDLQKDCTLQRALGIQWKLEDDKFGFTVNTPNKPMTRRGLLSIISSLYDPLGFLAPCILPAKKLLQELCTDDELGWDDEISEEQKERWKKWLHELDDLDKVTTDRCLKPKDFGDVVKAEIHVFSDASTIGYGSVAYLRIENNTGRVHVSFLLGKARLSPIKPISIPRLELTAAKVSVHIGEFLKRQLDIKIHGITYHTDSTTVLHYLQNAKKRFPVYVANRVKAILDFTTVDQWRYVDSKNNPADDASRGMKMKMLLTDNMWLQGPDFLRLPEDQWPQQPGRPDYAPDSILEEIHATATTVNEATDATQTLINHYSSWYRLKRAVAIYIRFFSFLKRKAQKTIPNYVKLSVTEIKSAELAVIRHVQKMNFQKEIEVKRGRDTKTLPRSSPVYSLDPEWDDENKVLRVGGRLRRADLELDAKHPILLPKHNHVTEMIIREMHEELGHAGRNHVLSSLRERYWVINSNSAVRSILFKCVTCRKIRGNPYKQKMADLPKERVNPSPPFTHTGIDYFGPFTIKDRRKCLKRYGVMFTCLSSRAIHLEVANSLDTDSFLNALRRFIARRGNVKTLKSDNGTNFVGAERELRNCIKEMSEDKIAAYLSKHEIEWSFNPPGASHMGGIWERQIRTVRKVLAGMKTNTDNIDDESFRTLMCEIESIVNCRPLTTLTDDPNDLTPLCPAMILTGKKELHVPPPGNFQQSDMYSRKRWRRVQQLANMFWNRWKREFIVTLQSRTKWTKEQRNANVGDIVLLLDESKQRSEWNMGKIIVAEKDSTSLVRSVIVKTQNGEYRRPVSKIVFLLETE